jgi:hypothetical protein
VPPGAKGTTIFTGLVGQAVCASVAFAIKNKLPKAIDTPARSRKALNFDFIPISFNHHFCGSKFP